MPNTNGKIIKRKAGLLNLAEELRNVPKFTSVKTCLKEKSS